MAIRRRTLDELLVLRAQEGSEEAFRMLVERWQDRLWRHARRWTGRDEAASDVLQEAWIGVVQGLTRLRDPGAFRRWAFAIVSRKASEWQRRRGLEELREQPLDADAPSPSASIESASDLLSEALQHLPAGRRTLLALRYVEEFELWEIAEILHVPEGTVKSRLHHAREELRRIIERIEP